MTGVWLTVHRATHQIGGNCIEISTADGHRIILDVGRPLDAPKDARGLLAESLDVDSPVDGVLVSHPHQDHYGLLEDVPPDWPVYSGEATKRLIRLSSDIFGKNLRHEFKPWESFVPFRIGPFVIKPLLTDHSAFDAHMLLIKVHGRRILYSGDFRMHGRKSVLLRRLMDRPPANLDVLLMEGTNLGSDKSCASESDLEDKFIDLFRSTPGRVFVAWSAQNVDRTATLFRACVKSGRTLAVDLYTAEVMKAVADFAKLPSPGRVEKKYRENLKVVITSAFARKYRRIGGEAFVDEMARNGVSARALAETTDKWVVMVRRSLIKDYAAKGVVPNADDAWCWSMWRGYLENEDGAAVREWFKAGGSRGAHIHTSGHASPADLKAFARAMNPKQLVPIHGVAWDGDTDEFPSIKRLADGEPMAL